MKKLLWFITIFVCIFLINLKNTYAGVCTGKALNNGYCESESVTFTSLEEKYDYAYFLPVGFTATSKDITGVDTTGVAFCIDPALKQPSTAFKYKRELNLSTDYDSQVYKMYQLFVSKLQSNESESKKQRAFFEATLRVWTIQNGKAYVTRYAGVDFRNEASNFVNCADKYIDNNIACINGGASGCIAEGSLYTDAESTADIYDYASLSEANCFGNYSGDIKDYLNQTEVIWENPFKEQVVSEQMIEPTETDPNYYFTFTISNIDKFFDSGKEVSSLGLKNATFDASIYIGETDCSSSSCNATISNTAEMGVSSMEASSVSLTDTTTNELKFTVAMTKEQYTQNVPFGTVSIKFKYNHPMNVDNAYFSRKNPTVRDEQRMFSIINDYTEGSKSLAISSKNFCEHVSSEQMILKDGTATNDFSEFVTICGCNLVDPNKVRESDKEFYSYTCSTGVKVSGGLKKCLVASPLTENYNVEYVEYQTINDYCSWDCTETINFNDVVGKYKDIKAGTYFTLEYPETIANKKCNNKVKYNSWYNDYTAKLDTAVNKYNDYVEAREKQASATPNGECCTNYDTEGNCTATTTSYEYNGSYEVVTRIDVSLNSGMDSFRFSSCGARNFNVSSKKNAFNAAIAEVKELLANLNTCNTYLSNFLTDEIFYDYEDELLFSYNQTVYDYASNSLKTYPSDYVLNSLKEKTEFSPASDYTFGNKSYDSLNTGGIISEIIKMKDFTSDYTITRYVTYGIDYKMDQYKYTNSYFGNVLERSGKNTLDLGYVYNVDLNAAAIDTNDNYFKFNKLGDHNKIYNHFFEEQEITDVDGIVRASSVKDLERSCSYSTINDLICIPGADDRECLEDTRPSSKIMFKIVDHDDIDPNGRIDKDDNGFENWKDKTVVKEAIEESDTFNPDNLEYSFELDSLTIKSIRQYNEESNNYLDYNYDCNDDGNYCLSNFIEGASDTSSVYSNIYGFDKSFATIHNGRSKWKTLSDDFSSIYDVDVSR